MKRSAACSIALLMAVLGAACGSPQAAPEPQRADVLYLRGSRGLAVLETGSSPARPRVTPGATVTSSDWSTVLETDLRKDGTDVDAVDPATGAERWKANLKGRLQAKLLSEQGDLAALGPLRERHYTLGRARTELVIAGSGMIRPRRIVLAGNYEPEAFSTDGEDLFVIKYLPAHKPTKYQVRRLHIDSGKVRGVYTPHEELQRPMGGTARIQVASPDGRRLYTLYTQRGANGEDYAFIHVLALDDMWAHCISLPAEFARRSEGATALTVSPDGRSLFVANSSAQKVAEIDTQGLEVVRTEDVELGVGRGTHATHDSDGNFYFSTGRSLTKVDTSDLTGRDTWRMPQRVTGIQTSESGPHVYVGMNREVAVLNGETGSRVDAIDPEGLGRIDDLGAGMRWLDTGISKCAC